MDRFVSPLYRALKDLAISLCLFELYIILVTLTLGGRCSVNRHTSYTGSAMIIPWHDGQPVACSSDNTVIHNLHWRTRIFYFVSSPHRFGTLYSSYSQPHLNSKSVMTLCVLTRWPVVSRIFHAREPDRFNRPWLSCVCVFKILRFRCPASRDQVP